MMTIRLGYQEKGMVTAILKRKNMQLAHAIRSYLAIMGKKFESFYQKTFILDKYLGITRKDLSMGMRRIILF